ncbi:MAG: helix-turn-helix transcriptional regulator, partial [Solobacterium sp.]|nr:helix-turn-helix transcriptional regulator [Solobacterium sp.]
EEFCDEIGIRDKHKLKIEAGNRTGSLDLIVEMAEYFHVSLDYLLLGETESNSKAKRDILTVIENLTRIAREL